MSHGGRPPGPGLTKVRTPPLLQRRTVELVACSIGRLRALFDEADVVSEGGTREELGALVYYGSTSLRIALPPDAGAIGPLNDALARDPHLKLRSLRVAQREACARAGGPLGPVSAELRSGPLAGAARPTWAITVDVTASVLGARVTPSRA